jgi:hypothetical protein
VLTADQLRAPVEEPGEWIPAAEFRGRKSFGAFQCAGATPTCSPWWWSAHAQARAKGSTPKFYAQQCKSCRQSCQPAFMWRNFERRRKDDEDSDLDSDRTEPPHLCSLCEACKENGCPQVGVLGGACADSEGCCKKRRSDPPMPADPHPAAEPTAASATYARAPARGASFSWSPYTHMLYEPGGIGAGRR